MRWDTGAGDVEYIGIIQPGERKRRQGKRWSKEKKSKKEQNSRKETK